MAEEIEVQETGDAMASTSQEDQIIDFLNDEPIVEEVEEGGEPNEGEPEVQETTGEASEEVESVVEERVGEQTGAETPVVSSEVDSLREQISTLQGLVSQLSVAQPQVAASKASLLEGLQDLFESVDFDEIMESKEKFMGFLAKALEVTSKNTADYVRGDIPEVLQRESSMRDLRDQFYGAHPELNPVRPYVSVVANQIADANPEWTVAQVLTETAKVAKAALKIQDVKQTGTVAKGAPILPGGTNSARTPSKGKSALQSEIDDLLED